MSICPTFTPKTCVWVSNTMTHLFSFHIFLITSFSLWQDGPCHLGLTVKAVALNDSCIPPLSGFCDFFLTFPRCLVKGASRYLKRTSCWEITLHCCFFNVKNQDTTNQISLSCPVWGPHTQMSSSFLPNWAQPQVPIHRIVNKPMAVTLSK